MTPEEIKNAALDALDDLKAREVVELDVRELTGMTDYMIIASGTSNRHVKSLADNVAVSLKAMGEQPLGVEGQEGGEWVLVDFGPVVVHVQLPETRAFYDLEKLWRKLPSTESDTE